MSKTKKPSDPSVNSLGQPPIYEPLSSADMDALPAAFKMQVMLELLAKGPVAPGDLEAAIDAKLAEQRKAAPHAERDAAVAKRTTE